MSGPAPKHPSRRARRNNPKADFTSLPAEGRKGEAPAWPLLPDVRMSAELEVLRDKIANLAVDVESEEDSRKRGRMRQQLDRAEMAEAVLRLQLEQATDLETQMWAELWATPQAVMWDESTAFRREVAQYVRWKVRAEQGDLKAGTEARMMSDRLGLNPLALLKLRREVEEAEAAEERGKKRRGSVRQQPEGKGQGDGKGKPDDDPRAGLYAVS